MKDQRDLEKSSEKPALVLYRPDRPGGLWDPEMAALVDELEEQLNTFVTCVCSGAGSLGLDDAAAAARFMGHPSIVVVGLENSTRSFRRANPETVGGGLSSPAVFARSRWSAPELTATYLSSCGLVRDAA